MVDAGQELPGRLSRAMESLFGGFGWRCIAAFLVERCFKGGRVQPRHKSIDFATRNGEHKGSGLGISLGYHVVARARVVGRGF